MKFSSKVWFYKIAKYFIKLEFRKSSFHCPDAEIVESLKGKSKLHNIIFTRADKRNTIVALDEDINKTISFIKIAKFNTLDKDPSEKTIKNK